MTDDILLHGCPRCQGTMRLDEDIYGLRMSCMMCGHDYEVPSGRYPPYDPLSNPLPYVHSRTRLP